MESGNKRKPIEEMELNCPYGFSWHYTDWNKEGTWQYSTSCRAHSVMALMAYMNDSMVGGRYYFESKDYADSYFYSSDEDYINKVEKLFRDFEKEFGLKNQTEFSLTKSKNGKRIIKIKSSKFWVKSVAAYSLFLWLIRSGDKTLEDIKERYPKLSEFCALNKKITQKFGFSNKNNLVQNELQWDSYAHDYGITEFFSGALGWHSRFSAFYSFADWQEKFKKVEKIA